MEVERVSWSEGRDLLEDDDAGSVISHTIEVIKSERGYSAIGGILLRDNHSDVYYSMVAENKAQALAQLTKAHALRHHIDCVIDNLGVLMEKLDNE